MGPNCLQRLSADNKSLPLAREQLKCLNKSTNKFGVYLLGISFDVQKVKLKYKGLNWDFDFGSSLYLLEKHSSNCNMYDIYLFIMLFTKFLMTQILEILMVNKLL